MSFNNIHCHNHTSVSMALCSKSLFTGSLKKVIVEILLMYSDSVKQFIKILFIIFP